MRQWRTCFAGSSQSVSWDARDTDADEAIGAEATDDLAIKKGLERVIEAKLGADRGQAFTDDPSEWSGTLADVFALDLSDIRQRAVFVAGMNALLRSLGVAAGTVHCRNDDPTQCGLELAQVLQQEFRKTRLGLIGLQPAILRALVETFGRDFVRVLDLNPDNIGTTKFGVSVWNGQTELPRLVEWCDLGLATGSSVVNGSINEITDRFEQAEKPLIFFGNTIAGTAALLGLRRMCPFGK